MRLLSFATAMSVSIATVSPAQTVLVGGQIGTTSATQQNYSGLRYDRLHGWSGGAALTFQLRSWLALRTEALYTEKGARLNGSYEMRIDYLEAPILARVASPVALYHVRPFVVGGVAPSVELRCSGYTTPYTVLVIAPPPGTVPLDCNSQRKRYNDRGQVLGAGALYDGGGHQITLEFRRTRGVNIAGYDCCTLRNDVTSIQLGVSRAVY